MDRILEEYKKVRLEIETAKKERDQLHKEKEEWFTKKEELKTVMNKKIFQLKQFKQEKDKLNTSIQEIKKARDLQNNVVGTLIKDIKKLNDEKKKLLDKYEVKDDPTKLLKKINQLEERVETETSFKKEQKYMEQIKKLRKMYEESSEVLKVFEQKNKVEKEIKIAKEKADELHKQMLSLAHDTDYAEFIKLSQEITVIKKEQEAAFQQFITTKNKFIEHEKNLREKIKIARKMREVLEKNKVAVQEVIQEQVTAKLKEKGKNVEEKLKKGGKLTTDDLLAFQGS